MTSEQCRSSYNVSPRLPSHPRDFQQPYPAPCPTTMPNLPPPSRQSPPISPSNPPSAPSDLGPTLPEGNPEPEPSNEASILKENKDVWIESPKSFFASAPIHVDTYTCSDPQLAVAGTIAFRLRAGEFYRCRLTWGQRGKTAFLNHVAKYNPKLSRVDYDKWMNFGKTTEIISQNCIAGTIVASSCLSLRDSRYRMVPLNKKNKQHISFLEELCKPEIRRLAARFQDLEQALAKYIFRAYSGLRKRGIKSRGYDQLQDFSLQQALYVGSRCDPLPAEPCQDTVIDSFSHDPTLDNIGRNGPVGEEQLPYPDQQPQATEECSKILTPIYVSGQSHEGGAYPMSGHLQNDVQQFEGVTGQPSQQPPQPVTSFSFAHDTCPISMLLLLLLLLLLYLTPWRQGWNPCRRPPEGYVAWRAVG
ncbi:hypothetical protein CDEST_01997 [Colletotrichum destructivum]|uniref:Uncharacterized protein n=1 Tax=Colletotrichum destructivum TaxID=34406 RepID=A0AAX4I0Q7_9PEZI|nr:hypothetical protein CDEST_01997 [Colletotrichum destructivum]